MSDDEPSQPAAAPADRATGRLTVTLVDEQDVPVDHARLVAAARRAAEAEGAVGELSLLLVDEGEMARLHVEHMGEEGPTDVLSFPVDGLVTEPPGDGEPPVLVGEVVVCPGVAVRQAPEPGGPGAELELLVVHGVLHLLGHDHDTEEGAEAMRDRERRHAGRAGAQGGRP